MLYKGQWFLRDMWIYNIIIINILVFNIKNILVFIIVVNILRIVDYKVFSSFFK